MKAKKKKPLWEDISHLNETCKYYWARFDSLHYIDEILYHKWESVQPRFQTVLPKFINGKIMKEIHCNIMGGHLGFNKTLSKARDKYFWHKMSQDKTHFCKSCDRCAGRKSPNKIPKAQLQKY